VTFTFWAEGGPSIAVVVAAVLGLAWGFASDRVAARWPAHEDGSIRPIDWRTPVVMIVGALAAAGTVARFGVDTRALLIVGTYVAALILLLATDLDQRLLPDVITLPLVGLAVLVTASGASPFIRSNDDVLWAVGASILIPLGLALLARPFGAGAIGQGDLKLLVSVGLLTGAANLLYGLISGAVLAGLSVGLLLLVRRISLKSYVPYGPFLIVGVLWTILRLPQP
jgi:prepilin signal peptidase PulO-like enzyme (type II secretory pathway)